MTTKLKQVIEKVLNVFRNDVFPSKEDDGIEHMDMSYKAFFERLEEVTMATYEAGRDSGENRILAVLRHHGIDYSEAIKTRREWDEISGLKDD